MAELNAGLTDALAGRGRIFLIGGEPGIGKSRLADELSTGARDRGARVLWGRCWEAGGAPAYWPWVQAIRSYIRQEDPATLKSHLGTGAADVAQIIPELHDVFPELRAPASPDPEGARFRLFDSTTTFLRNAAGAQPIVLVLDDLHAADDPSLLLLRFLAAELADLPLLVIGIYRDEELDHPELASTLAEVGRLRVTRHIDLAGLGEPDMARFIEWILARSAPEALVAAVHRETEGNPLFVGEVIRLLAAEGKLQELPASLPGRITIPPRIREVISRRIGLLSKRCHQVLSLAAVLGREFRLDALAEVSGLSTGELLEVIDEAAAARVVMEVRGGIGGMYFSHVLIRDAFYDTLSPTQRVQLHRASGETLERLYADDPGPHLAELAHHFCQAAPGGSMDKAVTYAWRAGERAAALLAYEEGVRLFRLALLVLEMKGPAEGGVHCRLLLALGDSQTRAGDLAGGKETFLRAATLARKYGMAEQLADAALGYGGRFVWGRGSDRHLVPLLQEALKSLPEGDSAVRTRVMARLAGALRDQATPEPRDRLSYEAVEIARRIDDPATLSYALEGRFAAIWGPDNTEERLGIATEILRLAREAGDGERIAQGLDFRMVVFMERGEIPSADAEMEAMAVLMEEIRQPAQLWIQLHARAMRALFDGRFGEAERLIPEALEIGKRAQPLDAVLTFRIQTYMLRREQGRLEELEPVIKRSIAEYPTRFVFRSLLAHLCSDVDRPVECREAFEGLAVKRFSDLPKDMDWLFAMSFLPEVADFLDDPDRAATLYELLVPYAERHVAATANEASTGSVARGLGILASTLRRWREAVAHFENALERNAVMGAWPWVAHTQYDYSRMLVGRDQAGDRERAVELLAGAAENCERLGMQALGRKVATLQEEEGISAKVPTRVATSSPEPWRGTHVFRPEGEYWLIMFEQDAFRLKDSKGLRYLAHLLGSPNREFLALELLTAGRGSGSARDAVGFGRDGRESGLRLSSGQTGEILDPQAKETYRRRLEELQEELKEAEDWADAERAARAREEMEFLAHELAGAVGLGGRDRRAPSDAERARVNVTKAIRAALAKIGEHSPTLGRHLASTIRTGTFCSYVPDPRLPASWQL